MHKLLYLIFICTSILVYCSREIKPADNHTTISKIDTSNISQNENLSISDTDFSQNAECVRYIAKYKEWIRKFVKVKKETRKNPNDSIALINYKKLEQEGKALGEPSDLCAGNRSFQDSLLKITEYAAKALNE